MSRQSLQHFARRETARCRIRDKLHPRICISSPYGRRFRYLDHQARGEEYG
jgi:hypothetical protein